MHHGLKYSSGNTFFYDKIYTKHAFNGALNSLFESVNLEIDKTFVAFLQPKNDLISIVNFRKIFLCP